MSPNKPGKGVVNRKSKACRQSTVPEKIGVRAEMKAKDADIEATGIAKRAVHLMPVKFTAVNVRTMTVAMTAAGRSGKYHCLIAAADNSAVIRTSAPNPTNACSRDCSENRTVGAKRFG